MTKKWLKITIYIVLTLSVCAVLCLALIYKQWQMLLILLLLLSLRFAFDAYFSIINRKKLREFKENARTTDEIEKFINENTFSRFFESSVHAFFSPRPRPFFYTSYDWDLIATAAFHRNISKGKQIKVPKLRTEEGKQFWMQYIKAFNNEHAHPTEKDRRKAILEAGGWLCSCGRVNPSYTSTCVCGTAKRNVPQSKYATAESLHWRCTCGRENPDYTSTCVCGINKRDAQ